ncbi:MAG: carbohydrate-binding protein [Cyanobacteria bacterium P01_F01_bin.150]
MNAAESHVRSDQLASRNALKRTFQNRIRLSETHFALLIHSTLNKRDDQFHGHWKAGYTYRKGDVVYYKKSLWEMTADKEVCGEEGKEPGVGDDWTSILEDLEKKVAALRTELEQLCTDFQAHKKLMEDRWQRVDFQLNVLTVAVGILGIGWLLNYLYHLVFGVG